jgi:16S rRNA (guanine527-N7)-methyltransferase
LQTILKSFPEITPLQQLQFEKLQKVYEHWNAQINVISRKDIDALYTRHVLHSLGIAKIQSFLPNAQILDVGTGGGFPGIPLAILFPETQFHCIDALGKKIKVVQAVIDELGLKNATAEHVRSERVAGSYDFVVSRAVTNMTDFVALVQGKIKKKESARITQWNTLS